MDSIRERCLRFEDTSIDKASLLAIQNEIGESPQSKDKCLKELRKQLNEVKDLDPCLDEEFLLAFLRVAKYDVAKAFQRIINYYTQHDKLLDAFENISMSVSTARSPQHIWVSPYRLENNSILVVGRGPTFDFNSITLIERFYLEVVVVNSFINNPLTQLYGITAIFDYAGFRYSSIFHYTPGIVRLLVNTLQNSLPLPVKACHIVNLPPFFSSVANIAFSLLSKKIRSRITFHPSNDDWKSLHAVMNPELLPEEFGGNMEQSKMIDLSEKIDELELQLMERFKFGYIKSQQRREVFRLNPPISAHKPNNEDDLNLADNDG
ncbi:unnamed protein product [Larinioides sclopetarius]|uniref:CRAL-TRIO domain-containing protein n=1 Tax=Larinioides sclopetarius TaxID=280406 RepID=A0AAV1ZAV5_9ARAC